MWGGCGRVMGMAPGASGRTAGDSCLRARTRRAEERPLVGGILLCCIPLTGVAYLSHVRPNEGVFWGALEVWSLIMALALALSFAWEQRHESKKSEDVTSRSGA
ncbi:hypothetical protein GCM10020001_054390 [Nonomuraea salmonea]